jgi:Methyltransferase domain
VTKPPLRPRPLPHFWARLLRAPAVRAALIQVLALVPMLALAYLLDTFHITVSLFGAALMQGAIAALLGYKLGLASWWRPIQFLFPVALLAVHALALPPVLFLIAFLFLLGLYWSTFRTQVPFYPSGPSVWSAVAELLPAGRPVRLVDIGSGLGGLVLNLAARRPDSEFIGIELAPLPWLWSRLRAAAKRSGARFVRGDYEHLDFADYDVVFAYLSPAVMTALWRKAEREMRPGTMLLSYEFGIDGKTPSKTISATAVGPALYVWYF